MGSGIGEQKDGGMTDAELIRRFIEAQDQKAFTELVLRFQTPLRKFATRLCKGDTHMAEDLVQDTFLRAFLAITKFRGDSKFSTWLHSITFNLAMEKFRRRTLNDGCSLDDLDEQEQVSESIDHIIASRDLDFAMSKIQEAQGQVIYLCLLNGHSHGSAAQITGQPLGTVKTNVRRGRLQLQQHLHAWCEAA